MEPTIEDLADMQAKQPAPVDNPADALPHATQTATEFAGPIW